MKCVLFPSTHFSEAFLTQEFIEVLINIYIDLHVSCFFLVLLTKMQFDLSKKKKSEFPINLLHVSTCQIQIVTYFPLSIYCNQHFRQLHKIGKNYIFFLASVIPWGSTWRWNPYCSISQKLNLLINEVKHDNILSNRGSHSKFFSPTNTPFIKHIKC
jgi:hypothetical protein